VDPEQDELRREIAELGRRVARLEAVLAQSEAPTEAPCTETRTRRGENLETRIGSRLFNRVGIVAVLFGVAWFLKIAFDNRWLGAVGKVCAGVVAGLGLIGWSEWFHRHDYDAFSYSLKAVGAGLLYLSVWAAWSLFHLVGLPVAATAMAAVTAGIGILAWQRESEILAFYAAVGGYLTPVLLSDSRNHEAELFGYLLILGAASMALIAVRPWPRLALGAFAGTAAYGIGWYACYYSDPQFGLTLGFAVVFLVLFAVASVAGRTLTDSRVVFVTEILNAGFAFVATIFLFSPDARAWAAFALAGFYFVLARFRRASAHDLIANCFVLAAVSFGIHSYWRTWSGAGFSSAYRAVDEEICYSAWFMVSGAILLAIGFWRKSASLRWQGLAVLCFSIAKVFLVDMRALSQGYRVLSFLGLGALLLAVSFAYQKDWLGLRGGRA